MLFALLLLLLLVWLFGDTIVVCGVIIYVVLVMTVVIFVDVCCVFAVHVVYGVSGVVA